MSRRGEIIHAAQQAIKSDNARFLSALLGKDQAMTGSELDYWSAAFREKDANGIIDPFEQGQVGNCFIVGGIVAVKNTPEGRNAIADSIAHNTDGTHTITFKGDPANPITVTESDLNKTLHSDGDKDTALLEVGLEKYAATTGKLSGTKIPGTTREGGQPSVIMSLLTGKVTVRPSPP